MDPVPGQNNTQSQPAVGQLPSIGDLLSASWDTFKKSWLHLFVFNLVSTVVILLILGIGFLVLLLGGAGAAISGAQSNFALTGGLVLLISVVGVAAFVFLIIWAYVTQIGSILIVSKNGQISLDETIKQSFPFILPLFIVGIVSSFLAWGGVFLFLLPGIVIAFFFMFMAYEIVLNNKSGLDALRYSMGILLENFWGILGRVLLLIAIAFVISVGFEILQLLFTIGLGKDSSVSIAFVGLISIARFIFQIAFSFFSAAYAYTLYTHAKNAAGDKKSSLLWPTILAILGYILFVVILVAFGAAIGKAISSKEFLNAFKKGMNNSSTMQNSKNTTNTYMPVVTLTPYEADILADDTFFAVSVYRKTKGLKEITKDNKLCAYASRRLAAFVTAGKYDDGRGFYEDLADAKISQAYFSNYYHIAELSTGVNSQKTGDSILQEWIKGTNTVKNLDSTTYYSGCIMADSKNIVFTLAGQ